MSNEIKLTEQEKENILKIREALSKEKQEEQERALAEYDKRILRFESEYKKRKDVAETIERKFIEAGCPAEHVQIFSKPYRDEVPEYVMEKLEDKTLPSQIGSEAFDLEVYGYKLNTSSEYKVESWKITGACRYYIPKTMLNKIIAKRERDARKLADEKNDEGWANQAFDEVKKNYDNIESSNLYKVQGEWKWSYASRKGYNLPDYWKISLIFKSGSKLELKVVTYSDRYELKVLKLEDAQYKATREAQEWLEAFASQK